MSKALDLLNNLSAAEIAELTAQPDPEGHIIVGGDRNIRVPENLKRLGVQYDHNMETVTFDCPRYWDKRDMSKMAVYINYMRYDGYADRYPVDNVTVDGDVMHFDWTISRNVTETAGTVSFLVCVMKTDSSGNEERHWNSELCSDCYVSKGMETEEHPALEYPDEVTQLLLRMVTVEQINVQAEEMQTLYDNTVAAAEATEEAKNQALDASGYIKNSYAPAIKGNVSGEIIRVDDVSPIEHDVKCWVHGKNIANLNNIIRQLSVDLSYTKPYLVIRKNNTTEKWSNIYIGLGVYKDFVGKTLTVSLDNINDYVWSVLLVGTNSKGELVKEVGGESATRGHTKFTLTIPEMLGAELLAIRIVSGDNKVTTGEEYVLTNIQVEESPIETVYEPYIDPSTIEVTGCGKNMFDSDIFTSVTGWTHENGVYSGLPAYLHAAFGPNGGTPIITSFKPSTQYTVSFEAYADVTTDRPVGGTFRFEYTDGSHDSINVNTLAKSKYTFVSRPDKSVAALRMSYGHNITTYLTNVQLEEGSVATIYESYMGSTAISASDGTCIVASKFPTMTLFTDTPGVTIEAEYNRDTTKMFESYVLTPEAKSEIAGVVESDMAEILASLNEYAESLIGG